MSKSYKPTTPSRRQMLGYDFSNLSGVEPLKSLTAGFRRAVGRNNQGRITSRHRGGGVKRLYRVIDFKQDKHNVPAKVFSIEYDPNRTVRIARLNYIDGDKRYILAPEELKVGSKIVTSDKTPLEPGNRMKLKNIPQGTIIHNIELHPGKGGQLIRSAGSGATVLAHEGEYVQVVLPSSEVRRFHSEVMASIGQLSNAEHSTIVIGKAGRSRYLGRRPKVRGTAMNPVDHPHGGGEGRQPIGMPHPKTPWGKPALGVKTRKKKKKSWKFIVRRRKK
ncbi:MAG: 50S ribosomal protein L2 [Candidatus Yanofskybacteria bacterium RIFCSPHIGHO2_01_FULL_44_17]|uniref:Large ribosomal subunit protein uL2 n=1 Tax=Candidatus Yanofskybacteria bacterium RIFCSPHIGHO2_01_FULL_44_17 TaxID=1802668 RepID=A0A1F8ESQ5_9BACT|nr:MAG: 50S ribosomal protein L2 [Candidatus Yanofskybacteria bacterium RIFCSPHIGHO2_01_FULL_44_17]